MKIRQVRYPEPVERVARLEPAPDQSRRGDCREDEEPGQMASFSVTGSTETT
jgi:hypothetical protein